MITCFLVEMKLSDWKVHWRIAQFVISRTTGILFCWYRTISGSVNVFVSVEWVYVWVGILNAIVMLLDCSISFKIQHVKIVNQLNLNWHLNVSYWATYILVSIIHHTDQIQSLSWQDHHQWKPIPLCLKFLNFVFSEKISNLTTAQEGIHPPDSKYAFLNQFECILQPIF